MKKTIQIWNFAYYDTTLCLKENRQCRVNFGLINKQNLVFAIKIIWLRPLYWHFGLNHRQILTYNFWKKEGTRMKGWCLLSVDEKKGQKYWNNNFSWELRTKSYETYVTVNKNGYMVCDWSLFAMLIFAYTP